MTTQEILGWILGYIATLTLLPIFWVLTAEYIRLSREERRKDKENRESKVNFIKAQTELMKKRAKK